MFWIIVLTFIAAVFIGWNLPQPEFAKKFQEWVVNAVRQLSS